MPSHPVPRFHRRAASIVAVLLVLTGTLASGEETYRFGLHTDPAKPFAGQVFTLGLTSPPCDVFWSDGPLDRQVEVVGYTVRVTVEYTEPAFGGGCEDQSEYFVSWHIGPLSAGSYTLEFVGDDPIGGGHLALEQMPFTVVAPAPSSPRVVSATQTSALMLLALSMAAVAWSALRAHRH